MSIRNICFSISALFFLGLTGLEIFSQTPIPTPAKEQKWIRVQSDNTELSIDVPDEYDYFYDKDGFLMSYKMSSFVASDVKIFNSYRNGTLLSFESYKFKKPELAMRAIRQGEEWKKNKMEEIERGKHKVGQIVTKKEYGYLVRQYFVSSEYLYILAAGSRTGETEEIRRFFTSVRFDPSDKGKGSDSNVSSIRFSELKPTFSILQIPPVEKHAWDKNSDDGEMISDGGSDKQPDSDITRLTVLDKPRSSYTDEARRANVQGTIVFKVDFSANGAISRLVVTKALKNGLLRQAAFAAMRIKVLPEEKKGLPVSVTRTLNYGFTLY
jgi:hypothetical protein